MGTTFDVITKLHTVNCGSCGGIYAIQERYRAQCEEEGKGWHCPYCKCNWGYFNDNENARLKKQLKAAEAEQERLKRTAQFQKEQKERAEKEAEHFRRSRDGVKGVLTKFKKRVGKGICPCCNRQFVDLQRHMASRHPDVALGEVQL